MFAFILSRLGQAIPVLLVVGLIAFATFTFVGDPTVIMLGHAYTEAQRGAPVPHLGHAHPLLGPHGRH